MNVIKLLCFSFVLLPWSIAQADDVYCPQNAGYIRVGMSTDDVISACGQPLSKQKSNMPVMRRIPVTQLIYNTLNTGSVYPGLNSAFYQQWSLSSGTSGISLEVDVIDNRVSRVLLNGSSTNTMNICGGMNIQMGDNVSKVYSACGGAPTVNKTFIEEPIPSNDQPEIWIYHVDQFNPPMSLTFVNGKLESISK